MMTPLTWARGDARSPLALFVRPWLHRQRSSNNPVFRNEVSMLSRILSGTGMMTTLARSLRARRMARKAEFDLSRLNDRALRDIGISRFELPHATGHSLLWRWPD